MLYLARVVIGVGVKLRQVRIVDLENLASLRQLFV